MAVVGVPDSEMGEAVKAVIETAPGIAPSSALADELIAFARARMAHYTVPRSIDFIEQIPRLPTGKLYKRGLRDAYWEGWTTDRGHCGGLISIPRDAARSSESERS